MIALKASEIAQIVGGELKGSDVTVTAAPIFDSSQVTPGSIFLALKGEKADGHNFVSDAFSRGAVLAFVTLMHFPEGLYSLLSPLPRQKGALLYRMYLRRLTN